MLNATKSALLAYVATGVALVACGGHAAPSTPLDARDGFECTNEIVRTDFSAERSPYVPDGAEMWVESPDDRFQPISLAIATMQTGEIAVVYSRPGARNAERLCTVDEWVAAANPEPDSPQCVHDALTEIAVRRGSSWRVTPAEYAGHFIRFAQHGSELLLVGPTDQDFEYFRALTIDLNSGHVRTAAGARSIALVGDEFGSIVLAQQESVEGYDGATDDVLLLWRERPNDGPTAVHVEGDTAADPWLSAVTDVHVEVDTAADPWLSAAIVNGRIVAQNGPEIVDHDRVVAVAHPFEDDAGTLHPRIRQLGITPDGRAHYLYQSFYDGTYYYSADVRTGVVSSPLQLGQHVWYAFHFRDATHTLHIATRSGTALVVHRVVDGHATAMTAPPLPEHTADVVAVSTSHGFAMAWYQRSTKSVGITMCRDLTR